MYVFVLGICKKPICTVRYRTLCTGTDRRKKMCAVSLLLNLATSVFDHESFLSVNVNENIFNGWSLPAQVGCWLRDGADPVIGDTTSLSLEADYPPPTPTTPGGSSPPDRTARQCSQKASSLQLGGGCLCVWLPVAMLRIRDTVLFAPGIRFFFNPGSGMEKNPESWAKIWDEHPGFYFLQLSIRFLG